MGKEYIENHFSEIIGHESEIEYRLVYADCSVESLKTENARIAEGYRLVGEQVVLIDSDYDQTIKALVQRV